MGMWEEAERGERGERGDWIIVLSGNKSGLRHYIRKCTFKHLQFRERVWERMEHEKEREEEREERERSRTLPSRTVSCLACFTMWATSRVNPSTSSQLLQRECVNISSAIRSP